MKRLSAISGIDFADMLFMGDAVYPDCNDYAVYQAGIDTIAVLDVETTNRGILAVIYCRGADASPQGSVRTHAPRQIQTVTF